MVGRNPANQPVEVGSSLSYYLRRVSSPSIIPGGLIAGISEPSNSISQICTLPETNGSPLKINGWKMILSFWQKAPFSGATNVGVWGGNYNGNDLDNKGSRLFIGAVTGGLFFFQCYNNPRKTAYGMRGKPHLGEMGDIFEKQKWDWFNEIYKLDLPSTQDSSRHQDYYIYISIFEILINFHLQPGILGGE